MVDYLKFISRVEEYPHCMGGARRTMYHVGDRFMIEISSRMVSSPYDNANIWYRKGLVKRKLNRVLTVDTYFYDVDGNCWGLYNPTVKVDGSRHVLDFDAFDYEDTEENRNAILRAAIRMREMDIRRS